MKIAICTIMKNGHEYLDEWLTYNFQLGFDNIFIYEDYDSDSHLDICKEYNGVILSNINDIIKTDKKDLARQLKVYNAWIDKYRDEYDWVAFIDLDEFIVLDNNVELKAFLTEYVEYPGIFLFWKIFTANGYIDNPRTPLLTTYTDVYPLPLPYFLANSAYKSFVNLKVAKKMADHHTVLDGVDVNKKLNKIHIIYDKAWINHYFTRSWEEWVDRFTQRGHICTGNRKFDEFFIINKDMKHMEGKLKMSSLKKSLQKIKEKNGKE